MAESASLLSHAESDVPLKSHRDDLMISLSMARIIMALGFLGALVQPIFAGISFFFVLVQYLMLPKFYFVSYYSYIGPSLSFGYCYVCIFGGVVNTLYTMWAWIIISKRYAQVMYTVSAVLSIVTVVLSVSLMKTEQMFSSMGYRNRDWYLTESATAIADWEDRVFGPYQVTDIFRCLTLLGQAIAFAFAHHVSYNDLAVAMSVPTF
jgi:hypothetical protein